MPVFADALPEVTGFPTGYSTNLYGLMSGMFTTLLITCLILLLFTIVCTRIIFRKAGRKGRESIIPFWNTFVTFKIAGKPNRFWFLLIPSLVQGLVSGLGVTNTVTNLVTVLCGLFAFVGVILFWIMLFKLAKKFGKSGGFGVGLLFLNPIFLGILAFGKAQYIGENND